MTLPWRYNEAEEEWQLPADIDGALGRDLIAYAGGFLSGAIDADDAQNFGNSGWWEFKISEVIDNFLSDDLDHFKYEQQRAAPGNERGLIIAFDLAEVDGDGYPVVVGNIDPNDPEWAWVNEARNDSTVHRPKYRISARRRQATGEEINDYLAMVPTIGVGAKLIEFGEPDVACGTCIVNGYVHNVGTPHMKVKKPKKEKAWPF